RRPRPGVGPGGGRRRLGRSLDGGGRGLVGADLLDGGHHDLGDDAGGGGRGGDAQADGGGGGRRLDREDPAERPGRRVGRGRQPGDGTLGRARRAEVAGGAVAQVDDLGPRRRARPCRRRGRDGLGRGAARGQRVEDGGVGRLDVVAAERGAADDRHGPHERRLVGQLVGGRRRLGGGHEQGEVGGPRWVVGPRLPSGQDPLDDLVGDLGLDRVVVV